jgi:hypothetical protein
VTEDIPAAGKGEQAQGDAVVPLGYIFAVIVPFVGLILGIIAATRPAGRARKNGPWIIALATVAFAVWGSVIYAEVHHSETVAAQHSQARIEEAESRVHTAAEEVETRGKEEAERQYCEEHPHAGEHMAGGYFYYECTPVYEVGG